MPAVVPKQNTRKSDRLVRPWFHDALSAFAFIVLAVVGGKTAGRMLGPIGGLFYLLLTGGTGYFYARAAWRGLTEEREKGEAE